MNALSSTQAWVVDHELALGMVLLASLGMALLIALLFTHRRDLQRLRKALRERELGEARLDMALDASGAAQWEWHIPEKRIALSDRYYEQLGYPPGAFEATQEQWRMLLHPDDVERALAEVRQALHPQSQTYRNEYRLRNATGEWRWMLSRGQVVRRSAGGEPLLMMGTHQDIHEAKTRQEAERAARERFQKIYETTPDAMGITRVTDGLYVSVNHSFTLMTGYSREEALGRTSTALGIWAQPAQRDQLVEEFRRSGQVDSMEMLVRCKDGRLLTGLMSVRHLSEQGQDCMLFIFRDVSERLHLQQEAQAARQEMAVAAAASRAKTEFLSRMSHELRTPLNAVLGFAQLLREAPLLAAAHKERGQVEAILQAGWHLLTLIDDVLDIARIESGHLQLALQPVALLPLLAEAVELLRPQAAEQGVRIDTAAAQDWTQPLLGDPLRLRQVLVNLLSNAVKYNRAGGRVELWAQADEGQMQLHIRDNGLGMSAQQMAHLFEPFNRLGRERESIDGTGIGLVLTRHLLALMGGSLHLQSRLGEGTTVSLRLPLAATAPATEPQAGPPLAADSPRACVLYIEDNPVNQLIVQQALQPWQDLTLHLAGDGAQGLRRAAELRPDLILLDMRLPDMDGIELLRRLRADPALAGLKVVALSASAMPDEVARAEAGGALEYWTKPLRLDHFLDDLRRVLKTPR